MMRTIQPTRNQDVPFKNDRKVRTGRLPDFLVIGAMKAGTTTFYQYLSQHPGIFMCKPKEPQFFSRSETFAYHREWYRNLFRSATSTQLCGESSTCYSRWPHHAIVPERIARTIPDARLIYLMRHPVERCYSHYSHRMQEWARRGMRIVSFDEYLHRDAEAISASMYIQQIERYLSHFRREQFLFLIFDDLVANPASTVNAAFSFLGVPQRGALMQESIAANASGRHLALVQVQQALQTIRQTWGVRHVADCIPTAFKRQMRQRVAATLTGSPLGSAISRRFNRELSPLADETRAHLLHQFEESTRNLERFLGRSLPHWHV